MVKKVLLGILVLLVVVIGGFVAAVAMQPNEFSVTRSTVIEAPPEVVHAQVNDFHSWPAWSPWEKLDPNMERTLSEPAAGEGAVYEWKGNDEVGHGKMTILESKPGELVKIKLDFYKPMEDTSTVDFRFEPQDGGTKVEWAMAGESNIMFKAMCLFMDMDAMIGGQFEQGLAEMKKVAEAEAGGGPASGDPAGGTGEPEPETGEGGAEAGS